MTISRHTAPSLFDDGHIGSGLTASPATLSPVPSASLIDLLYQGFYIVFLIRNQYIPTDIEAFRRKVEDMLAHFEQQARKLQFAAEDIQDAKYAYCALLDETIVTQQNPDFFHLQNAWLVEPLQLSLFGSQLAGYRFFEILETLRVQGKQRLAALEIYHYCLLLGFHGKYRIESIENLNHLASRIGDEIDFLKGKKAAFSPFSALPDQIKNVIHRDLPFYWILAFLLLFIIAVYIGLHFMLQNQAATSLSQYSQIISMPTEQANITIYLP